MLTKRKGVGFKKYASRFGRQFVREAVPWARDNIFWGLVVLVVPPIAVALHNRAAEVNWDIIKTTLWLYLFSFLAYGFVHFIRTSWKLDQEREKDIQTLEQEKERTELKLASAEQALSDKAPKLSLEYSAAHAHESLTYSGLFVRNGGQRDAFTIRLSCDLSDKFRLYFEDMPIQRISPDKSESVEVRTHERHKDGRWGSVGGTPGKQIEMCFDRMSDAGLDENVPVTIKYLDYEGTEHTKPWRIRRAGEILLTKKIWCEPA